MFELLKEMMNRVSPVASNVVQGNDNEIAPSTSPIVTTTVNKGDSGDGVSSDTQLESSASRGTLLTCESNVYVKLLGSVATAAIIWFGV